MITFRTERMELIAVHNLHARIRGQKSTKRVPSDSNTKSGVSVEIEWSSSPLVSFCGGAAVFFLNGDAVICRIDWRTTVAYIIQDP